MSILYVGKIKALKVWVSADAKIFMPSPHMCMLGKTDGVREKKGGIWAVKGNGLSHVWKRNKCYCRYFVYKL
jgi:hypothetical protein